MDRNRRFQQLLDELEESRQRHLQQLDESKRRMLQQYEESRQRHHEQYERRLQLLEESRQRQREVHQRMMQEIAEANQRLQGQQDLLDAATSGAGSSTSRDEFRQRHREVHQGVMPEISESNRRLWQGQRDLLSTATNGPGSSTDREIPGFLDRFPTIPHASSTNGEKLCSICLEWFHVGKMVKLLPCLHRFHGECLDPWVKRNHECPVCRFDLDQDESSSSSGAFSQ